MTPTFEATVSSALETPPLLAARWVRRLFRTAGPAGPHDLDSSTGLYNRAGLLAAVRQESHHHADRNCLSAVVLEFSDLREVRDIYGAAIGRKVVARVIRRLRTVAGLRGLVGRTGPCQFTVVFPGVPARGALSQLQRGLGKPARVEFDAGDSEIVLVPEFVLEEMEPGESLSTLLQGMTRELSRTRKHERRRLVFLATERERHSRPMVIRG